MQLYYCRSKLLSLRVSPDFQTLIEVSGRLYNAGLSLRSRYSRLDRQQIFCASVRKNQWGPSKYGYLSLSIPQQYNAKQYWVALIVRGCRPCIIAATATVSHSKTTIWLLNCGLTLAFLFENESDWMKQAGFEPPAPGMLPNRILRRLHIHPSNYMCKSVLTLNVCNYAFWLAVPAIQMHLCSQLLQAV